MPRNTNKNDSFKSIDETPISSSNNVNASMDTTSFNRDFVMNVIKPMLAELEHCH